MKARNLYVLCAALAALCVGSNATAGSGSASPSVGGPSSASGPVATITGTVRFEGQPPKSAPINMAAEPACAKLYAGQITLGEVVLGTGGTLGNVIVYVSSGLENRTFEPPSQPLVIDQKGCMYSPHVVAVQANQKIQVINNDPTSHNIHPIPMNNREWNKSQPPGMPPIETSFAREEIAIPVKCNVHAWMRSYIGVFKHPYFAVTEKEGSFELRNLPPGTYTITAWHEKFGTSEQKIQVSSNESKKLEFIFKAKAY